MIEPTGPENHPTVAAATNDAAPVAPERDFAAHPCFSKSAHHRHARIHLPVAPRCNLQCNFCNRKFDCMNESRPGVTSAVLTPERAADYLDAAMRRVPNLSVVGIAGPGDPFANGEETMLTLKLVRERHPRLMLCLATNGLGLEPHIDNLAALEVSHVTLTVNAVDPEIGTRIYAWIRDGHRPIRGHDAAKLLLDRQLTAIAALKARGIVVKINTIIIPGINDQHVESVARRMAELKVDLMNCMAFLPVAGAEFESIAPPESALVAGTRLRAGRWVPQMTHCARCRADAVGLIHGTMSQKQLATIAEFARPAPRAGAVRPYVAVASLEGMLVNQHLGEAARVLVFQEDPMLASGCRFVEVRKTPEPGAGAARWAALADVLHDCRALLVSAAGPQPRRALEERGVAVLEMEGLIEEGLRAAFTGRPIPATLARRFTACGAGCKGTGTGCA